MKKDLLTLNDISTSELYRILDLASEMKKDRLAHSTLLQGKSIGMIFAKASTRTRVSFDVGISELGGHSLYMETASMQMGRGETAADTARTLSRYLHGIVIRTYEQQFVVELAKEASIPVINALTDEFHPCQILADLMTVREYSGEIAKVKLLFAGDARSNIANSLILAAKKLGFTLTFAAPAAFKPDEKLIGGATNISWDEDALRAAEGADYLYTDVWVSMGFEDESSERLELFRPFQVNMALVKAAKKDVKILHCLPAHRDEEISAEVMDSPYSIVFDEAENRLHVQKAVMAMLIGGMK